MAKKIIISFNSNPVVGIAFDYTIQVDGLALVYPNGANKVSFEYRAYLSPDDPTKAELKGNVSLTIDNTLSFLNANYATTGIVYQRVNNTIEVSINVSSTVVVYIGALNPNISITTTDISNITTVGLKYFFQYKNDVNDIYLCQIFKNNYLGTATEIHGIATLEKASVNNHLDPIRGGGLQLELEASESLTLEDLYSEKEQDVTVKLYKNENIMFYGYLNPDGVFQDFVRDEWKITLDCVDGLGAISNLSFVQSNGLHFNGKMRAIDIIYQCLKRTGILMNINVAVNIKYDGLSEGYTTFESIYLNADRFVKTDNDTIMSCEDVLKSILDIFKAVLTQSDGEWYIYKPNEIYLEPYVVFNRFNISNVFIGNKTVNLNKSLGSHADNFYPHHCGGNQKIQIKGSLGGFRLGYKYGFVSGLLPNPKLIKNGNTLNYDGWTVNDPVFLLNDPFKQSGFYFDDFRDVDVISDVNSLTSDALPVDIDDDISLEISFEVKSNTKNSSYIHFRIQQGIYFLKYAPKNSSIPIDDIKNAVWTTNPDDRYIFYLNGKIGTYTIQFPKILADGNITINLLYTSTNHNGTVNTVQDSTTLIKSLDLIPTQSTGKTSAIEGEFHTVERADRVSSIVKANQTVYNGDNPSLVYLGAIYDINQLPTTLWSRKNSADKFPLLRIAAEEELRIAQKPMKIFRGDFYGYIPYLSFVNINNVGYFMPIEWSYNTFTNITTCKQLELFVAEVNDIVYNYSIDYGETVKPTIK